MNMLIRFFIMVALLKTQKDAPSNSAEQVKNANNKSDSADLNKSDKTLFLPIEREYRVLPHDMGFRHHLPNYRYLSFIELNITKWVMQTRQRMGIKRVGWIISMQEMLYLKEVRFLSKLHVKSQLIGWDEKYVYFQHHFYVKNTLMAIGMTKVILTKSGKKLSPSEFAMPDTHLTEVITSWNKHQQQIKNNT